MRIIHDQMAGWLEDALRPELGKLHREFLWQYLLIYDQWARFHAQSAGIEDQQSLAQLAVFAEAALRDIASQFPVRLWLNAIRSIPLPVFAYIALPPSTPQLMELVKIATSAACRYGDRNPSVFEDDDENGMVVELEWLQEFKRKLPVSVPRFIGAAHTWYYARGWYRIAGKGGVLRPPQLADLKVARDVLDRLEPGKIMLVPSATFENGDEIMPQVLEYDRRTAEAGGGERYGCAARRATLGFEDTRPAVLVEAWHLGESRYATTNRGLLSASEHNSDHDLVLARSGGTDTSSRGVRTVCGHDARAARHDDRVLRPMLPGPGRRRAP
jgi:hypothetical protein